MDVPGFPGFPDWGKLTVPPFCTAQMWLKLSVFSFEQTSQFLRCEIFRETGVTQVSGTTTRRGTTSRRFSKFSSDFRHLISHRRSRYESRNDFDYRRDCVLAWWRRLVLGTRARLTRLVLS